MTDPQPGKDAIISTDSGPVTLVDLNALSHRVQQRRSELDASLTKAKSLRALVDDRFAELGRLLVENAKSWSPAADIAPMLDQARTLQARIGADSATLTTLHEKERHGISGLMSRAGDWNQAHKAETDKAALEPQLRTVLAQIARAAPPFDFAQATNVRAQAQAALDQASILDAQTKTASDDLSRLEEELQRRQTAQSEMGFDAPYLAAYYATYGPPAVESPLQLKRAERAIAVLPVRLARQQSRTRYVGGSSGVSFPIGHTGNRYRVGSYHGHPIQSQVMTTLDSGSLEITNQRIAFIGAVKSTSVALEKILHVECYSDALAVFREGRENPDFFLTNQPKYALFVLNWATGTSQAT
jgi:hypothetical protein